MRGLTKSKEVGGDGGYEDGQEEVPIAEEVIEPSAPPLSRLEILQNKLNELGDELAETEQADIRNGKEAIDQQYELNRIKNDIDVVTKEIQTLSQGQGQLGGKKQKKISFNKKYNIRWT